MAEPCPVCAGGDTRVFYPAGELPVHSTLLMTSKAKALDFPRRPLELAWCRQCGFIFNHLFDPSLHQYSAQCEESQSASPVFSAWLDGLVTRLVQEHGIRGKRVLEIGCGKGEFLARLCAAGDNAGTGYDPAYVAGRAGTAGSRPLEVHQRFWDETCGTHAAQLVACRHTLEHIPATGAFLRQLRSAIGQQDTLVFFDLPDAGRVLDEGAFWDVYYEHCAYFTAASLSAAFSQAGFEVLEQWPDYAGQFLMLLARPAAGAAPGTGTQPPHMQARVAGFVQAVHRQKQHWQAFLGKAHEAGERVVVWGGGSKASAFLSQVEGAQLIEQVVDINPNKQGFFVPGAGQQVVAPQALHDSRPQHVVLMNPVYRQEVAAMLQALQVPARLHCLGALSDAG
jgi:hypothetical protein